MDKIINLEGRINSNNIQDIESKILEDIKDYNGNIIFDAKGLEYISSAGLRMILRVKKINDNTKVINCNSEVYEVFEMTGFSEMMDISKAFREISVEGCEIIGDGFYGTVYRINPETIVKVYKTPDCLDMVKREKELARKAFILGIPTAIPYDIVKVGNSYGSVFELLDCKALDKCVKEGEDISSLAKLCVNVLKKMHSTELNTNELPNKKDLILETAEYCKKYLNSDIYDKLIKFIKNIPDKNTLIHGDFQIKNLMKQGDELLLIDMDKLSIGNPIFEFGAMYATYKAFACVNKNNPLEFLGIPYEQSEEIWNKIYDYYFDVKSDELLNKIKMISYLEVLYIRARYGDKNNEICQKEIQYSIDYITNNINNILED